MKIVLRDTLTTYASGLVQYDFGQYLEIYNTKLEDTFVQFQFIQNEKEIDQLGEYYSGEEYYKVRVPDEFLKNAGPIQCFLFYTDEESGSTEKIIILNVKERASYVHIPDGDEEHIIAEILNVVNYLKQQIDSFELTEEQVEYVLSQVISKMGTDYYTKEQADEVINEALSKIDLTDYATIEEMSKAISDALSKIDFSEFATKQEVDSAITEFLAKIDLSDFVTTEEMADAINETLSKIDFSDYVTIEEVAEAINEALANIDLVDYVKKEEIQNIRTSLKNETLATANMLGNLFYTNKEGQRISATVNQYKIYLEDAYPGCKAYSEVQPDYTTKVWGEYEYYTKVEIDAKIAELKQEIKNLKNG